MTAAVRAGRALVWAAGLVVLSVGIALTIHSRWGVGSVDLAVTGVVATTGVHLRVAVLAVHAVLIGTAVALGEKLRWPTLVASAGSSWIIAGVVDALEPLGAPSGAAAGWVCTAGVVLLGVGAGTQIAASVGPSPFEMLTVAVARRTGGLTSARTAVEAALAAAGVALGGQLGWGSVVAVACTGVVINLTYLALTWHRRDESRVRAAEAAT